MIEIIDLLEEALPEFKFKVSGDFKCPVVHVYEQCDVNDFFCCLIFAEVPAWHGTLDLFKIFSYDLSDPEFDVEFLACDIIMCFEFYKHQCDTVRFRVGWMYIK